MTGPEFCNKISKQNSEDKDLLQNLMYEITTPTLKDEKVYHEVINTNIQPIDFTLVNEKKFFFCHEEFINKVRNFERKQRVFYYNVNIVCFYFESESENPRNLSS